MCDGKQKGSSRGEGEGRGRAAGTGAADTPSHGDGDPAGWRGRQEDSAQGCLRSVGRQGQAAVHQLEGEHLHAKVCSGCICSRKVRSKQARRRGQERAGARRWAEGRGQRGVRAKQERQHRRFFSCMKILDRCWTRNSADSISVSVPGTLKAFLNVL